MKYFDRFFATPPPSAVHAAQPVEPEPAPPISSASGRLLPDGPAQGRQELPPGVVAAALEGFPVFPVTVNSRHFSAARAMLQMATTDIAEIEKMAAQNPGCNFGMAMGDGIFALEMNGDFALTQFNSMAQYALLTTDDDGDWKTRLLKGGNTTWALYLAPEPPTHLRSRYLGNDLSIVAEGGWIPAPGSAFRGISYNWVDAELKIQPAPDFLAVLVFETPDQEPNQPRIIEFPGSRMW
jgi:hypothetical protein